MKKLNFKKKIIWGLIGVGALIIPTVAVSAVACSSEKATPKIIIKTQPQSLDTIIGQRNNLPTFSVAVENIANAEFTYQWYSNTTNSTKGATKIVGATSNSYTLKPQDLTKAEIMYFFVEISGTKDNASLKTVTSKIVSLTINSGPSLSIKSQPTDQTAIINQTQNLHKFSVAVNSIADAKLVYQWYESNTNSIAEGNPIAGANQAEYTISDSQVKATGTKYYYVKISGSWDKAALKEVVSNIVSLNINEKPNISISKQPVAQKATVNEAENLPTFSVFTTPINNAIFTYQWYSTNESNSTTGGTKILGATKSSYTVPSTDTSSATTKYFYVVIGGTINGVQLDSVTSSVATLTVSVRPNDSVIASALAKAINNLKPNVANFAATQQMQYMAPSYAEQEMLPQIQTLIQELVKTNATSFNSLDVSGTPIKINPNLITVSANPVTSTSAAENAEKSLTVSINYGKKPETNSAAAEANPSSNVTLEGFNGFSDEQKSKITTWFNQAKNQEKLMKDLLDTEQGKTFLANLLNQTFFKFVIKGLGNNFELQSVTLNNDLNFKGITGALSAFVLTIKTTAAAQYSNTPGTDSAFAGFSNFQNIPSGSIISFQLPLTFVMPSTSTNNNIYQPDYVLSSTYTNTTNANPSWVFMNGFGQFNPLISWTLPPYKQSYVTYPNSAGNVGVLGVNNTQNYPLNTYTLSIKKADGTTLVSSASLFFRFTQNATKVAYGSNNQLVPFGASYIQMPVFTPTENSANSVFNNIFQEILALFKSE